MISAVISFLGGSAFRAIWGEISTYFTKRQDHKFEIERMRLENELAASAHDRQLEITRVQAELGVRVIEAKAEATLSELEATGWLEGVKATAKASGVAWVDAWNAVIRPAVATWSVGMLTLDAYRLILLTEATASVCFAALGIYLADRTLGKRGK